MDVTKSILCEDEVEDSIISFELVEDSAKELELEDDDSRFLFGMLTKSGATELEIRLEVVPFSFTALAKLLLDIGLDMIYFGFFGKF